MSSLSERLGVPGYPQAERGISDEQKIMEDQKSARPPDINVIKVGDTELLGPVLADVVSGGADTIPTTESIHENSVRYWESDQKSGIDQADAEGSVMLPQVTVKYATSS